MKTYLHTDGEENPLTLSESPEPSVFVAYARWEGPERTAQQLLYPKDKPARSEWGMLGYYDLRAHAYQDGVQHQILALDVARVKQGAVAVQYDGAVIITEEGIPAPLLIPAELAPWVKLFADAGAAHAYAAQSNAMLWGLQKEWIRRLEDLAATAAKEVGDVVLRAIMAKPVDKGAVPGMSDAGTPSPGPDLSQSTPP